MYNLDKKKQSSKFSVLRVLFVTIFLIVSIIFLLVFIAHRSCFDLCQGGNCSSYCEYGPDDIFLKIFGF